MHARMEMDMHMHASRYRCNHTRTQRRHAQRQVAAAEPAGGRGRDATGCQPVPRAPGAARGEPGTPKGAANGSPSSRASTLLRVAIRSSPWAAGPGLPTAIKLEHILAWDLVWYKLQKAWSLICTASGTGLRHEKNQRTPDVGVARIGRGEARRWRTAAETSRRRSQSTSSSS